MASTVGGRALCALSSLSSEPSPSSPSISRTKMPLAAPVAMPMLRSGNACHQRLMRSTSVVAACRPVSQAGSLPRGWQGNTARPLCANCSAAVCMIDSALFLLSMRTSALGGLGRPEPFCRLEVDLVIQLLRDRRRRALHADGFRHLAAKVHEIGVEANLLADPGVVVLTSTRGGDQHGVGLVRDQRLDALVAEVDNRFGALLA